MSQRVFQLRTATVLATLLAAMASTAARCHAQDMAGGMPSLPKSMFGKKQDEREAIGPSLSATNENVSAIRVVGNSAIPTDQILNQLQTRVGRPFDPALVQRDVRKLAGRGWFVDVQPAYEQAPDGRVVIFKVVERPVVRYVEYLGNYGMRTKKLAKETDLKVGGPVDPYAVQEARRRLVDLYHRNGFNNVQISVLEGDKPTDHGIVFIINEGLAQKIWKVEFVGNEFVSSGRLKTKIDSKPPLAYLFKGYVDDEQINADVNKLTAYYRSFGYFDAKIGRQKMFDEKNKWMTLRFVIHEGVRYQVESVAFIGNKLFSNDSLSSGVELKPDSTQEPPLEKAYHYVRPLPPGPRPFEQDRMNSDVAWLKELYGSQGYVFADIKAEPIFLEEQGKLKLLYHIDEGKRWRVGNIYVHIAGDNPHTKIQTALNRLSFRSGQIADIREIRASERRLQASGLFMADPAKGVMPKITYHIPDVNKTEVAKGDSGLRGQSPDGLLGNDGSGSGLQLLPAPDLPAAATNTTAPIGPPLIAPPQAAGTSVQPQAQITYKVETPTEAIANDEQIDVHMYIENSELPATEEAQPAAPPAKEPQRYEARRYPYDNAGAPNAQYAPVQPAANAPTYSTPQTAAYPTQAAVYSTNAPAPTNTASPYRGLVVRTQSPYQPATSTGQYTNPTYGGQAVGATGPASAPAGSNPYAVKQVAITEPQLPPSGPSPTPAFGPPPITAAPRVETLPAPPGAPQYAPAPQAGPAPAFGPPPGPPMGPDSRITPIPPIPTVPYPNDAFTPMLLDPAVDMDVVLSEAQTGRLMLGVAVNSDAGLVGQILLDEQSFDISRYPNSWDDFVSGRAWRGGGQRLRIEAAPGTEVQRYLINFSEPYLFDSPYSLGLSGSYFTRRYQDWDEQRVGGRVSLGYQWVENDLSTAIAYRGEDVGISNPSVTVPDGNPGAVPELNEVVGHNAVHGFKWSIANDTRDSAFLATEGHFLQLELEQVVGSFQYPRAIVDARQYMLLNERPDHSGRHVLTLATKVGFTGNDTPIYDTFYAGGFSSMRGFDFRGASPVVQNAPSPPVQVGGDFEFLNTIEYLFPLTADDMIHGVAFCDFGTVNQDISLNNFRVAPGLGLRITVPAMGPAPIALDFAFPVAKASTDDTQVFSFSVGLQR